MKCGSAFVLAVRADTTYQQRCISCLLFLQRLLDGSSKSNEPTSNLVTGGVSRRWYVLCARIFCVDYAMLLCLIVQVQWLPLLQLNAAYAGDRYLVRFLMQRGADRNKVGRFHYTKPLSLGMGLTAEGWADKNGYTDVAKLLRFGL